MSDAPLGLSDGGLSLWVSVNGAHELTATQGVQLLEACRAKDRLDKLDALLRGDVDSWASVVTNEAEGTTILVVNAALDKANATANLLKQLLAALRLPDVVSGARPQARGGARGAYTPAGKVSSLDRARAAKSS